MAIKARGTVTLVSVTEIKETNKYYLLQSSTASKPNKPTVYPPSSPWEETEPQFADDSTKTLYTVECTVFTDDTFSYSEVTVSSSYEAAKNAYAKAFAAELAIANWCHANDKTLINGSKIYSGSIASDKINTADLFAKDITKEES